MLKKLLFAKKIIILLILFHAIKINASPLIEIAGIILDINTKEPLPSASIILFERQTNKMIKVELSDLNGKFKFSNLPIKTYIIHIQYMGYQKRTIDSLVLSESIQLNNIYLTPIEQNLSEINITAINPVIEQNATTTIVNVAESSLATGSTVYEILEKTPGVNTKNDKLTLRGKQLSLLIDGRLVNLSNEEIISLLQSMPASSIEKMELNSNPTGKYDGQIQAVLNIKTLKAKNDLWAGNITLGVGAGRKMRTNSNINLFYKKNKISLSTGWDYIANPKYRMNREIIGYSQYNLNYLFQEKENNYTQQYSNVFKLDINYSIHPFHSIGFSIRPTLNPRKNLVNIITDIKQENTNQIDSSYQSSITGNGNFNSLIGNFYYKTSFDSLANKELMINIDYYNYDKNLLNEYSLKTIYNDLTEKNTSSQTNRTPLQVDIRSSTIDYTQIISSIKFQTGLKTSWTNLNSNSIWQQYNGKDWISDLTFSDHFLYNEMVNAVYGSLSGEFSKINFQASLRVEHTYSKATSITLQDPLIRNYTNLFPNTSIEYNPSKQHQWILSYQKSIERPLYSYINPFLRRDSYNDYYQGNPSIKPQLNHIIDFTYGYNQQVFAKIVLCQMTPFIGSLLTQLQSTSALVNTMENYTTAGEYTFNISFNKSIYSWWYLNTYAAISYFKARHPKVASVTPTPWLTFNLSSTISLPHNWILETSTIINTNYYDGYYYQGESYSINNSFKKSFFQKRLTISGLISIGLPTWYRFRSLYNTDISYNNYDQRYFMISLNYKLGNSKNETKNRKSGIDSEKNRVKE